MSTKFPDQIPGAINETQAPTVNGSAEWPPLFRDVPLTAHEKRIFGADARRCEQTGFIFEQSSNAAPESVQTANFKANLCNPEWCIQYLRSDPQAAMRHPKLHEYYKSQLGEKWKGY